MSLLHRHWNDKIIAFTSQRKQKSKTLHVAISLRPFNGPQDANGLVPLPDQLVLLADTMQSLKHRRLLRPGCLRAFVLVAMSAQNIPSPIFQKVHL